MKKITLFLFKLHIIIIIIACYNNAQNNIILHAKDLNNKIDYNQQRITQLHQISDAHSQCLIQIQQQLTENQRDIDILRGSIQDVQHHISEIVNNTQKKSSQKINDTLNKRNDTHYPNHPSDKLLIDQSNMQKNQNLNNTVTVDVDIAYKKAVSLVLEKKQYNQAIEAFQNFIKNYPESIYQPNSHYWLGQLYYNKGYKDNAAYHFALVAKNYPKSLKASDALLKIGIIMQETEQKDKAKTIYRQVGKLYPNSEAAKQAQKRLTYLK